MRTLLEQLTFTHISLEQFNILLSGKATSKERADWVDHILDCECCGNHFRCLNSLQQEMKPSKIPDPFRYLAGVVRDMRANAKIRIPFRYALGLAAIMMMSLYFKSPKVPISQPQVAQVVSPATANDVVKFSVLNRVNDVNYKSALKNWGNGSDLTQLVKLSSKQTGHKQ